MILLNEKTITQSLLTKRPDFLFDLHLFDSIDSTNLYLKELSSTLGVAICCAEMQTQGRGRFGRHWHSPFGENIYCSSRWHFKNDVSKLSGLSLVTSLAVLAMLNDLCHSPHLKIKWPNDILWNNKKLSGSLIELLPESNNRIPVIIGIGLNVNTDTQKYPLVEKPWCSLYEITHHHFDRNEIIVNLMIYLDHYLNHDLNYFMEEWNQFDYLVGKRIKVLQGLTTLTGTARGINSLGQLILEDELGVTHILSSGDTSLHET